MKTDFLLILAESSDKMSKVSQRLVIALAIVLIIFLLAVGYLVKLIKYILKVQGNYVNETMYQVLEAKMIKDYRTFKKESWRKNRIKFYFEARLPMCVLIIACVLIFFYTLVSYNASAGRTLSWGFIGEYTSDMFFRLYWPTEKFFGLNIVCDWPTVTKAAVYHFNDFRGWLTYIFDLTLVYVFIHFMVCSCALLSRNIRTITIGNEYFKKDIDALKKLQEEQKAQQPPIPEPSEELEEYLNKGKNK